MKGTGKAQECAEYTKEEPSQELCPSGAAQPTENDFAKEFPEHVINHLTSGMNGDFC
jgi:hypothetical protein